MRTFTRATIDEARDAWDAGGFSPEWRPFRHRAVMGGLLYPPTGTAHDSWEDDNPSQRAILIRAIRETPRLLERCIDGAPSWSVVIERLLHRRDEWRADLDRRYVEPDRVTDRQAVMSLGDIVERIATSRGVDLHGPQDEGETA